MANQQSTYHYKNGLTAWVQKKELPIKTRHYRFDCQET